jgi:tol-pal system protein YbgF
MKFSIFTKKFKIFFLCLALLPGLASAGIFDDKEARKAILELNAKIEALSKKLEEKIDLKTEGKADKTSLLEFSNQSEQLRSEMAQIRGHIEVVLNELATLKKRQQDFYIDLDTRLRKLEPIKKNIDGREVTVDSGEERAYNAAMALFQGGQYENAIAAFTAFSANYPNSGYAATAHYWLGNSYYAHRDCKGTISTLQSLVKKFSDNPKVPDAMLNIATCQLELKEKAASRKTLESVIAKFPGTESAQAAKSMIPKTK